MDGGFTRQEVIAMTGARAGNLSYLDSTGLVEPQKYGNPKHPTVIYTVEQVLHIKVIERLREKISLQEIRKVLRFLEEKNYRPSLFTCNLVLIGKELYLIENGDMCKFGTQVLKASGKNKGQVVIHEVGPIGDVIAELRTEAHQHHVLDFDNRARGTILETAQL